MDPATLAIAHWLVSNVGQSILNAGIDRLLVQMGIKDPSPSSRDQVLIEKHIRQLEEDIRRVQAKLDEDRLAKLRAALVQVREAQKTVARREYLTNALNNFHVVVNYPEHDSTGNYTNAQLRCIAFVGMAAAHTVLNDSQSLVAEKVAEAVRADIDTAKEWLGEKLVNQILPLLPPIPCPKCGFRNPVGSQFCNRDGYPLKSSQKSPSSLTSQKSTLTLVRPSAHSRSAGAFHIMLDGNEIGRLKNGNRSTFEVQRGHHTLLLRVLWLSTSPLTFDIALGEEVTFYSQINPKITLWEKPSPQTPILHLIRKWDSLFQDFQIVLDGNEIGSLITGCNSVFALQAGHHTLLLRKDSHLTPPLIFDIALGEEVTFYCEGMTRSPYIKLWKQ